MSEWSPSTYEMYVESGERDADLRRHKMKQALGTLACVFMLLVAIACLLFRIEPAEAQDPDPDCPYIFEEGSPECDNGYVYDGYWWYGEGWVPGLPDYDSWFMTMPVLSVGDATWYAPGVMEGVADFRGYDLDPYMGGVALTTCAHLGQPVWLRVGWSFEEYHQWEGPYLVVDCARQNDIYGVIAFRREIVEVDYQTAARWACDFYRKECFPRTIYWRFPDVWVSFIPPDLLNELGEGITWVVEWVGHATFMSGPGDYSRPVDWGRTWRLDGEEVWLPVWRAWYYEKEYWRLEDLL